jgi:hypothetical protein
LPRRLKNADEPIIGKKNHPCYPKVIIMHLLSTLKQSRTYLKNGRSRSRARREPIRRRPKKRAMAGQAQKRSIRSVCEHFKEAHDAPWFNKIDANPASRDNAAIGR